MRSHRHRVFIPAAAVAASTVLAACHRGDSILLVEVAGDLSITPVSLRVTVDPSQAAERTFQVAPKDGSVITLPASLSVEMAPDLTGPVTVGVAAIDAGGFIIADGTTTLQNINVGGQTIVVVTLISGAMPPVDAGTDASAGSGGRGGAPGVGGGGGGGAGGLGAGGRGTGGSGTGGGGAGGKGTGGSGTGGVGGTSGAGGKGTGGMSGAGGKGTGGMSGAGGKGTAGSGGGTGGTLDAGGGA